jgi:hypothetical protein
MSQDYISKMAIAKMPYCIQSDTPGRIMRFPREHAKRTIINIRGTNCSGKTTVVERMMKLFGKTPLTNEKGRIWAYRVHFEPEFYVLGSYEKHLGGCDRISSMEKLTNGIQTLSLMGNVLFEGVLVSILTQPWVELTKQMPDCHFIFATLDTPKDLCVKRCTKRRKKEGIKHWAPNNLLNKYKAVHQAHKLLKKANLDVRHLPHDRATQNLINWMLEDRYGPGSEV